MSEDKDKQIKKMEGRAIANKKIHINELNFENRETFTEFLDIIDKERRRYKIFIYMKVLGCLIIYAIFLGIYNLLEAVLNHNLLISVWVNWLVVVFLFLILYLIFRTNAKLSPTLVEFIKETLREFDLQLKRKRKYIYYFIIFNTLSTAIMGIIFLFKITFPIFFYPFLGGFFLLCLITPLAIGGKKDKYYVKLKNDYEIEFNFHGKKLKIDGTKRLTVGIYMISNHLCYRWEQRKKDVLEEISGEHWLPQKGRFQIFPFSPYLYLYEYGTVINFERRFLNLALAIREWDKKKKQ